MENDKDPETPTSEPTPAETPVAEAVDANNNASQQQTDQSPQPLVLRRRGAPKGNKNGFRHGGRALQLSRQAGIPIDKRTVDGQIQMRVYGDLLAAWGRVVEEAPDKLVIDTDSINPVAMLRIWMVSMGAARVYQHRRARRVAIQEMKATMKRKGQKVRRDPPPKLLQLLDSYELPAVTALRNDLAALGEPPNKEPVSLNDILQKLSAEGDGEDADAR